MDVRAIVLVGVAPDPVPDSGSICASSPEMFSGVPLALLPILGRPLVQRLSEHLKRAGVDSVTVLNGADPSLTAVAEARCPDVKWKDVPAAQIWRVAEEEFQELVHAGADLVIVYRAGAYADVNVDSLLQFHLDQRNHATQVIAADGPLDIAVLPANRRNDAAFLLRNRLSKTRLPASPFLTTGYVNRLSTIADFRRLVVDSLLLKTTFQPDGEQVRPGIWIARGAKIDRNVRLVAPCYIGAYSRVRKGALITRATSIEHHCIVDCASVVESSVLLPLTCIGQGLDVVHSVIGFNRIASVKYATELDVEDTTLVSALPAASTLRTLSHAANLLAFVPRQIIRNILGGPRLRPSQAGSEGSPEFDPAAISRPVGKEAQSLAPSIVAGMRDYGNQ